MTRPEHVKGTGVVPGIIWNLTAHLERRVWGVPGVVWLVVSGALLLRLIALWAINGPDLISASESGLTAANWTSGRGYTFDLYGYRTGQPLQAFMPPLFTVIIAASLLTPWPVVIFGLAQLLLSTLTVLLVYLIAEHLADQAVGLVAAALTAVYPPFLVLADQPTVPVLNTFLLGLWLFFSIRLLEALDLKWAALGGLVLGLCVLSRPAFVVLLVPTLFILWLVWRNQSRHWWQPAVLVVGTLSLTVAPWLVRNWWVLGRFASISTNGGFNSWIGNNPFTTGSCFDVVIPELEAYSGEIVPTSSARMITEVKPYPLPLELRATVADLGEVELDRAFYRMAFSFIQENPRRWLGLLGRKLAGLWWFRQNLGRSSGFYEEAWILPYRVLYAAVLALALAGLVLSAGHWRRYALLYGMFACLSATYVGYHVITRFRWEMEPYLLIFTALALVQAGRWLVRQSVLLRWSE